MCPQVETEATTKPLVGNTGVRTRIRAVNRASKPLYRSANVPAVCLTGYQVLLATKLKCRSLSRIWLKAVLLAERRL